jgi:hypothetical protein
MVKTSNNNDNKTNKVTKSGRPTHSANKKEKIIDILEHNQQDVRNAPSQVTDVVKVGIAKPGAVTRSRSGTLKFA